VYESIHWSATACHPYSCVSQL